jgi:ABC-2 type transport system permease protein
LTITAPVSTDTAAVECVDLSYQFATHLAVDHVNLSIAPGEMYGLLGPNGAGKTTTIRMITTLLTPGTGSVRVFGIDAAVRPMHVRRVIGYVPQALSADANLTGVENVELFARLFDVPRRARKQRVDEALSAMGLTEAASRLAGTYSGGMIRRLELAQSLISAPRLLVLDEPTVGLDPIARSVVWEYIARLRAEFSMTVLMTTHYMDEAVQPALWLLIYGEVFTRVRAIPTPAGIPYLAYLAPGIMAQSALFIAIFYGIQIIWERDAGVLTKLMVTPTPRSALITGKAFASGVRSLVQGVVVLIIAALLGVSFTVNPLKLVSALIILAVGSAFFSCLSMTLAGIVVARDRLMGIGQAITMPLFFSSSALYPAKIMPGWLQVISRVNPLTYEVEALRGLLIGTATTLWLDIVVLAGATIVSITCASLLLPRLANR